MRLLCLLGWVVAMFISAARAVEFEDYDFSRFSQEVTEDALSSASMISSAKIAA